MAGHLTSVLPTVEFDALRKRVVETKSVSTARYYTAMLNRLEAYNQSSVLDLSAVDSTYVSDFGDYLVREGVTFSTAKLFKMAFRAVLKEAYGSDFKAQFKAVFKDVGSKNDTPTNCMSLDDLLKITNCNLRKAVVLERVRLIFLYCVVSGGLSLQELKESLNTISEGQRLPQQKKIIRDFSHSYEHSFEQYVSKLSDDQYSQALEVIGISAGISGILKPQSAVDAWIATARKANVSATKMASLLPSGIEVLGNTSDASKISEQERTEILKSAANALFDMKPRWFVMKCFKTDPTEMDEIIEKTGSLSDDDSFSSFIPPEPKVPKNKSSLKKSVIGELYFFNCTSNSAANIRKGIQKYGWVYTHPGTSTPAQISDNEMKTFMLLCDVSEGTLRYHFPENQPINKNLIVGKEAKVMNGDFCGHIGIIKGLPNDKYKVVMTFSNLCLKVTAEVPAEFLKIL